MPAWSLNSSFYYQAQVNLWQEDNVNVFCCETKQKIWINLIPEVLKFDCSIHLSSTLNGRNCPINQDSLHKACDSSLPLNLHLNERIRRSCFLTKERHDGHCILSHYGYNIGEQMVILPESTYAIKFGNENNQSWSHATRVKLANQKHAYMLLKRVRECSIKWIKEQKTVTKYSKWWDAFRKNKSKVHIYKIII